MIQYAERVEDVTDVLQGEFGIQDTQAVEILLASRIECNLPYPWIILDTPCYRLDTTGAWFSHLCQPVLSLPILRTVRPRMANNEIKDILRDRDMPRLFVEPHWELPVTTNYQFKMWDFLLQECVRLKMPYPKTRLPDERSTLLVQAAVKRVLDPRWRDSRPIMPTPPPSLPYWCELLQRMSYYLRDWDCLITNMCALAGRRAYLFNKDVDSTDWAAVSRVIRDSVPAWTAEIVGHFGSRGRIKSLRGKYTRRVIELEMRRLAENGVLIHHRGEWKIRDFEGRGQDLIELLHGPQII
jgi:hypothetical protein